jgi:hypothetical protein
MRGFVSRIVLLLGVLVLLRIARALVQMLFLLVSLFVTMTGCRVWSSCAGRVAARLGRDAAESLEEEHCC